MRRIYTEKVDMEPVEFQITIVPKNEILPRSEHPDFEHVPPRVVTWYHVEGYFHIHSLQKTVDKALAIVFKSEQDCVKGIKQFEADLWNQAASVLRQSKVQTFQQKMKEVGYE